MTILVFGKTGQVATELQLLADVVALGRDQADLADPAACAAAILEHKPSVVINAAAYTAVDKAESDAETAQIINADAPAAMARACAARDIPFVSISSDYIFSGAGDRRDLPREEPPRKTWKLFRLRTVAMTSPMSLLLARVGGLHSRRP